MRAEWSNERYGIWVLVTKKSQETVEHPGYAGKRGGSRCKRAGRRKNIRATAKGVQRLAERGGRENVESQGRSKARPGPSVDMRGDATRVVRETYKTNKGEGG